MSEVLTRNPNPQPSPGDGDPTDGTPGGIEASQDFKGMDPEDLLQRVISWHRVDRDHWQEWRQEAAECYDFVAGHQWTDEDLQILQDQMRPAITFNRIGPFVDAVGGLEINNRQETAYLPRQLGSSGVDDLLTGAAQWVRQECDAEDEETEAFKDVVICGVGVSQTRMDYDEDPDGMIKIDRIDPLKIYPDATARKQNFADGKRVTCVNDLPVEEAMELFPDVNPYDLDARWARDEPDETRTPHNARIAPYYLIDQSGKIDRDGQMCRLVEIEWWQYEPAWRVLDPSTGRFVLLDQKKATTYRFRARVMGLNPVMIKDRHRKYYKAIFGARLLILMDGAEEGGFSYKFITGKRDTTRGTWYGIVRAMRDPQMWANKWLSQGLHILNTNAKGGYFAETDAFADIDEARDSLAEADSVVEVNPGKLESIKAKEPPAFPPQLNTMMEMATQAIPMVSGINMELMGQSTSQAPQVALLEAGRRQQGMNVLASLFNAKRRYQKEQGRLMLWMIQTYISDGRLIRIGGPENAKYVAMVHTPGLAEYDVIVDDAPTSVNMKEKVWASLMQLFPMLKGMPIPPQFYINALKYSPMPESFVTESQQILAQPPPPNPAAQGKEALDTARAHSEGARAGVHQAQAGKLQAETAKTVAETQLLPQQHALDANEQEAKIEKTRADAVNALQNAGITADDTRYQQAMQAINHILNMHGAVLSERDQAHQHRMDLAGHALAADQQAHGQQMAEQAAMQPQGAE